jgi:hypothetical protein
MNMAAKRAIKTSEAIFGLCICIPFLEKWCLRIFKESPGKQEVEEVITFQILFGESVI